MNILYRLMDKRTEEHSVGTDGHELQFAVELVLQGAGLIHCDVRCERVGALDVHGLHELEVELPDIKCFAVHGLKLVINLFEVSAGCPLVLIAGQYQQILRTGESRVVQTPEIKEFCDLIRFKCRALEVAILYRHHKVVCGFSRHICQRIHKNNRELHPFGLVDRKE